MTEELFPVQINDLDVPRVIGLDLSLASTGLAMIDHGVIRTRRITSKPVAQDLDARSKRLRRLVGEIWLYIEQASLVCVEGPSYGSTTGHQHDRAGLWWLTIGRATGTGLHVVEVPPTVVKTYATGKGNAKKDEVLAAVVRRYPSVDVTGNDEADALVLAAIGCRLLGKPIEPDLPATHLRAMNKIAWTQQKEHHG